MRLLYPEITAYRSGLLPVEDDHCIYFEESGNPQGIPVVFLHGGPGSGCKPDHRRYFDATQYRVILFDQRGCKRSVPQGETACNTTEHLLADMERLRVHLGIERWVVFGGSWGATLALLYAEQHPKCILALLLRGVFLARACDIDWFLGNGANRIFPEYWAIFCREASALGLSPAAKNLLASLYEKFFSGNGKDKAAITHLWQGWSGRVVLHCIGGMPDDSCAPTKDSIAQTAIELNYAKHNYFIRENQILQEIHRIPKVPTTIIHGRLDFVCPLESSWALYQALPHAKWHVLPNAGHLASEPPMVNALINATDNIATVLHLSSENHDLP